MKGYPRQPNKELLSPKGLLKDALSEGFSFHGHKGWTFNLNEDLLEEISDLLSIPKQRIVVKAETEIQSSSTSTCESLIYTKEMENFNLHIFVCPLHGEDTDMEIEDKVCQKFGVNQLLPLMTTGFKPRKPIVFYFMSMTTIMDLEKYIEEQWEIPSENQILYREDVFTKPTGRIVDILLEDDWAEINYYIRFLCKPEPRSSIRITQRSVDNTDEKPRSSIWPLSSERENYSDINIDKRLKTITIRFINGTTFFVLDSSTLDFNNMSHIETYIFKHLYHGKFDLYHENAPNPITGEMMYKSLNRLFLDKTIRIMDGNVNLIFSPDHHSFVNDTVPFLKHQDNLFQKIRLLFITREEVILVKRRLNVTALKGLIENRFSCLPYQQKLFHGNKELKGEELLTELAMKQRRRQENDEEELMIKVVISKATTVRVSVRCAFPVKHDKIDDNEENSLWSTQQFVLEVGENIMNRDLRQMIQDRIQQQQQQQPQQQQHEQGTLAMKINGSLYRDSHTMLYHIVGKQSATVEVFKTVTIRFPKGNGNEKRNINYIVEDSTETVRNMLDKFGQIRSQKYKLDWRKNHSNTINSNIQPDTLLVSSDSGITIHLKLSLLNCLWRWCCML